MTSILKVSTLKDPTNSNTALSIDASGRVTTPARPAWKLGLGTDTSNFGADTEVTCPFDIERILTSGVTHSAGVITVPVAGLYQINFTVRFDTIGSGYTLARMIVNNTNNNANRTYVIEQNAGTSYHTLSGSDIFEVDANSTFKLTGYASHDTSWHFNAASAFSGYLVG